MEEDEAGPLRAGSHLVDLVEAAVVAAGEGLLGGDPAFAQGGEGVVEVGHNLPEGLLLPAAGGEQVPDGGADVVLTDRRPLRELVSDIKSQGRLIGVAQNNLVPDCRADFFLDRRRNSVGGQAQTLRLTIEIAETSCRAHGPTVETLPDSDHGDHSPTAHIVLRRVQKLLGRALRGPVVDRGAENASGMTGAGIEIGGLGGDELGRSRHRTWIAPGAKGRP